MSIAGEERVPETGYVLINVNELERLLALRGKTATDLVAAKATSFDTLAKIRRKEKVSVRVLRKITGRLNEWPELAHHADLLMAEGE